MRSVLLTCIPSRWLTATNPTPNSAALLTFDDGPDPELTPRVIDLLASRGARATFFVIGERAQRHPECIRRILDAGHSIGNHSWSHPAPGTLSSRDYLVDVRRARSFLEQLSGSHVRLFRPPHGHVTAATLTGLWRDGTQVMLWNVDPKDYAAESAAAVEARLRRLAPSTGDVVLLHDTIPTTVDALPRILDFLTVQPGQ
jgi:peptidoglycan/xylan/chitin deacetylase (PgdA/CDA1 family)